MTEIRFGTDGWRGVVGEDFTLEKVRVVAQAIADYVSSTGDSRKGIVIGFDARTLSPESANAVAEVLAGNEIRVFLSERIVPTPTLVFAIQDRSLGGGVMVTASHNPPRFNGIKFKPHYAGSAAEEITRAIEERLWKERPRTMPLEEAKREGLVQVVDLWTSYEQRLRSYLDMHLLRGAGLSVVADPMHGCQGRLIERVLSETSCKVKTIHAEPDSAFGGLSPEPIPPHVRELQEAVVEEGADVGLATDADGDRVGAVDSKGEFVTSHQILAMLLLHLFNNRGWKGTVVKTITTSTLVEKIADDLGLPFRETRVGFKHICEIIRSEDVLIGGEESGGISFKNYFPERDGALSALLLLELMTTEGKRLEEIMARIDAKYGSFRCGRKDIPFPDAETKWRLLRSLKRNPPDRIGEKKVVDVNAEDGVKMILENDDWLMVRASGTEPLVRVYAEAKSCEQVKQLLTIGNSIAQDTERTG
jgi:alpha-D-glucose phosphate-specific phosphoglucomutase